MRDTNIAIIGIGNLFRSDDAVGIKLAQLIRDQVPNYVSVHTNVQSESDLMDVWKNIDKTILIDAVSSGKKSGTIFRLTQTDLENLDPKELVFRCSTHDFNLLNGIELAKIFNTLPKEITVYGIEVKTTEHGTECSYEVQQAIPVVLQQILSELNLSMNRSFETNLSMIREENNARS